MKKPVFDVQKQVFLYQLRSFILIVNIKCNGNQKDEAFNCLLPVNAQTEQRHTVVHDPHDKAADDGPADRTDSAVS